MTAKRTRSPAPSNNAAEAFDEPRNQVSLLHAAIEGLTAAKDKLPDYSPTPRKIEARLEHAAGLKFCRQSRPVRRILLRACVVGLGVASYQALLPAIVRDVLGGDELDYGFCLAAFGLCSIVVALFVQQLREAFGTENVIGAATMSMAIALAIASAASTFWLQLIAAILAGGAWVAALSTLNIAMQMRSPNEILGRCLAIYQATAFGALAAGAYLVGFLADISSLGLAALIASAWLFATLALRFLAPMPARHEGRVVP